MDYNYRVLASSDDQQTTLCGLECPELSIISSQHRVGFTENIPNDEAVLSLKHQSFLQLTNS